MERAVGRHRPVPEERATSRLQPGPAFVLWALALLCVAAPGLAGQSSAVERGELPFDAGQRRLVSTLLASMPVGAGARPVTYGELPPPFRAAFEAVTGALARVSLSDAENGEILGTAVDLLEQLEPLAGQPAKGPAGAPHGLAARLASGALDRLRRSSEFTRVPDGELVEGFATGYASVADARVHLWVAPDRVGVLVGVR